MEKKLSSSFIGLLIISMAMIVFLQGVAYCYNTEGRRPDRGFQYQCQMPPPPFHMPLPLGMKLLLDAQERNVLSKATGKSLETLEQQLACKPLPIFLEENGISTDAFRKAMDEQSMKIIAQALAAGIITKQQLDDIQKRINVHNKSASCECDLKHPRR